MPVSIIGTRGCGKSTLVGFLHQSMEKYTMRDPEKFAFYMDRDTTDVCLNKIRNRLHSGSFPKATARGDFQALSFLMSFEASKKDFVKHIGKEGLKALKNALNYENKLVFTVFDVSGEDIEEFGSHKTVTKKLKEIFDSNIMVILIDCSKLTEDIKSEKGRDMRRYDAEMSKILARYEEYRARKYPEKELQPIVFFTKMDMLDPEIVDILPNYGMKDLLDPQKEYEEEKVREDGEKLLKTYLSGIYQNFLGSKVVKVDIHKAMYFFSWAGVEGEDGVKPADEKLGVKWMEIEGEKGSEQVQSNIYPYKHYQKFLSHLGELSKDYSDPDEKVKEYLNRDQRKML